MARGKSTDTDDAAIARIAAAAPPEAPDDDALLPEPEAPPASDPNAPPAADPAKVRRLDAAHAERNAEHDQALKRQALIDQFGDKIVMPATLQDVKGSAASNGNNYDLTFEVGIDQASAIAAAGGIEGIDLVFDKLLVGNGAMIRRWGATRDADGAQHLKVAVRLPQSEISRSAGRMMDLLKRHALLELEPQQMTLPLNDGSRLDLTARAE